MQLTRLKIYLTNGFGGFLIRFRLVSWYLYLKRLNNSREIFE